MKIGPSRRTLTRFAAALSVVSLCALALTVAAGTASATAPAPTVASAPVGPVTIPVPPSPVKQDVCGTVNDTVTLPADPAHVHFENVVPGGDHKNKLGTIVVRAVAAKGFVFAGGKTTHSWNETFTNTPCALVTTAVNVELQAHNNSILPLGSASYYTDGRWHPITTRDVNNPAIVQTSLAPGTYSFAVTYNGTREQKKIKVTGSSQTVYFHTALVNVWTENHKSTPISGGSASYYAAGKYHPVTTKNVNNATIVQAEMLPGTYSFQDVYRGTREQKKFTVLEPNANNGAHSTQSVYFHTALVNVWTENQKSTPIGGGSASYYADGAYHPVTTKDVNNSDIVQAEMLPGTYTFEDVHQGTRQQKQFTVLEPNANNGAHSTQSVYFHFTGVVGPAGNIVTTMTGQVRGKVVVGYREFLGIPYAASPVGSLRWAPPTLRTPWSGVRDATTQGPQCPQDPNPLEGSGWSDDCLVVNVWTPPASTAKNLPVVMWIHGGAHDHSSGRIFDAARMAEQGPAVVVTINYRLGVFGNLALSALNSASPTGSGSFGLMDQVAALKWIHSNISAFGGDPGRVMIDGQSSGAADVCSLLASPPAAGLFSSAVIESASCSSHSQGYALRQGASFAKKVGCTASATVVECLRSKPTADIVAAEAHTSWGPSVGSSYLPVSPLDAFAAGHYNRVPVIKGATHDEARFSLRSESLSSSGFTSRIKSHYPSQSEALLSTYPVDSYSSPLLAWATVLSDQSACETRSLDSQLSQWFPLYTYEFDDPNAPNYPGVTGANLPLGPTHTAELAYLFDLFGKPAPFDAAQKALAHQMIQYWTTFARTGDPAPKGLPAMPRYSSTNDRFLSLRPSGNKVISNYATDHHCAIWDKIG